MKEDAKHSEVFTMADNKRNSVAGKVATPKTSVPAAQPSVMDVTEALGKAIGARLVAAFSSDNAQTFPCTVHAVRVSS